MEVEEAMPKEYMIGTCVTMCPRKEMLLREKENLLHRFEVKTGTEKGRQPKADPKKIVKCYSRSAAGREVVPSDLRPFPVLMKTIRYLFHNIFPDHDKTPLDVYDFMFDRLRAIRQDMVIQNLTPFEVISVLEPTARFHIYFGYILVDEGNFDSHINNIHLQECLKKLLVCYDESENEDETLRGINELKLESGSKNRCDIEGAYLLFNLPHFEAITRGAKLLGSFINDELLKLSFAWYLKNYVRVFNSFKRLSPLLLCVASSYIPEIRKYSLHALTQAFSSSSCSYPLSHLKDLLLYETVSQVIDDCSHLNIKVSGNNVNFLKKDFKSSGEVSKVKRLSWVDERLQNCDLVRLLCYGNE